MTAPVSTPTRGARIARPSALLRRLLRRVASSARRLADDSESGQGLLEFVIVFPAQFFVILAIMQFSFLSVGHVVVQHAAFVGARAALVADTMVQDEGGAAGSVDPRTAASEAARITCAAISQSGDATPLAAPRSGSTVTINQSKEVMAGATDAGTRVEYREEQNYISVVVEHDYRLIIPVARRFFERGPKPGCRPIKKVCFLAKPWKGST